MSSLPQFSPKQGSIDLQPAPALFGGITTDNFASLLRATSPIRVASAGHVRQWRALA